MSANDATNFAKRIVASILDNLEGRAGIGNELEAIDDEVRAEMVADLVEVIAEILTMLTPEQAAALIGVCPQHVRFLIREKKLAATKFGRSWLVKPAALDKLKRKPRGRPKKVE